MKAALVLGLAGVFIAAQVLKGGALDRLLSGSSSPSPGSGGSQQAVPVPSGRGSSQSTVDPGPSGALGYRGYPAGVLSG